MTEPLFHAKPMHRAAGVAALLALAIGLSGCSTSISDVKDDLTLDNATLAFVDPARYDYYDCKQLQTERQNLAKNIDGLKKEMTRADTGFAGPVVSEMVYRQDYLSTLGQARAADQAWKRNNCHETLPDPLAATSAAKSTDDSKTKPVRSRAGSAVY